LLTQWRKSLFLDATLNIMQKKRHCIVTSHC
jgi:hypothetical protein